eukprot:ANDGO_06861.mRNA.1 hypothetical protein PPTG_09369
MPASTSVYVLRCEGGKYYVGKSSNVRNRISDHMKDSGSAWTAMYRPLELIEVLAESDGFDEDKYVKKYMQKYGIENVRGGSYSQPVLPPSSIETLHRELRTAADCCWRCGQAGHFVMDCLASNESPLLLHRPCHRCEYHDHCTEQCFARTPPNDNGLQRAECSRCGRRGHSSFHCFAKIDSPLDRIVCYRCGRNGHYATECFPQAGGSRPSFCGNKASLAKSSYFIHRERRRVDPRAHGAQHLESSDSGLADRLPCSSSLLGVLTVFLLCLVCLKFLTSNSA